MHTHGEGTHVVRRVLGRSTVCLLCRVLCVGLRTRPGSAGVTMPRPPPGFDGTQSRRVGLPVLRVSMSSCWDATRLSGGAPYRSSSSFQISRAGAVVPCPHVVTPRLPPVRSTRCTSRSAARVRVHGTARMPSPRRRSRLPRRAAGPHRRRPGDKPPARGGACLRLGRRRPPAQMAQHHESRAATFPLRRPGRAPVGLSRAAAGGATGCRQTSRCRRNTSACSPWWRIRSSSASVRRRRAPLCVPVSRPHGRQ